MTSLIIISLMLLCLLCFLVSVFTLILFFFFFFTLILKWCFSQGQSFYFALSMFSCSGQAKVGYFEYFQTRLNYIPKDVIVDRNSDIKTCKISVQTSQFCCVGRLSFPSVVRNSNDLEGKYYLKYTLCSQSVHI